MHSHGGHVLRQQPQGLPFQLLALDARDHRLGMEFVALVLLAGLEVVPAVVQLAADLIVRAAGVVDVVSAGCGCGGAVQEVRRP